MQMWREPNFGAELIEYVIVCRHVSDIREVLRIGLGIQVDDYPNYLSMPTAVR